MADRSQTTPPEECDDVAILSQWRAPRWIAPLFGLAGAAAVVWIVFIVSDLPPTQRVSHWDVAWGGFDAVLAFLLISVAVSAWRRSPRLHGVATAAATLLLVDAWFDVLTSKVGADRRIAITQALLLEVPMAVVCLLVARNTERTFLRPAVDVVNRLADAPNRAPRASTDEPDRVNVGR